MEASQAAATPLRKTIRRRAKAAGPAQVFQPLFQAAMLRVNFCRLCIGFTAWEDYTDFHAAKFRDKLINSTKL
jgi:hypothetical protein